MVSPEEKLKYYVHTALYHAIENQMPEDVHRRSFFEIKSRRHYQNLKSSKMISTNHKSSLKYPICQQVTC